jgi:hypothetical protein
MAVINTDNVLITFSASGAASGSVIFGAYKGGINVEWPSTDYRISGTGPTWQTLTGAPKWSYSLSLFYAPADAAKYAALWNDNSADFRSYVDSGSYYSGHAVATAFTHEHDLNQDGLQPVTLNLKGSGTLTFPTSG